MCGSCTSNGEIRWDPRVRPCLSVVPSSFDLPRETGLTNLYIAGLVPPDSIDTNLCALWVLFLAGLLSAAADLSARASARHTATPDSAPKREHNRLTGNSRPHLIFLPLSFLIFSAYLFYNHRQYIETFWTLFISSNWINDKK